MDEGTEPDDFYTADRWTARHEPSSPSGSIQDAEERLPGDLVVPHRAAPNGFWSGCARTLALAPLPDRATRREDREVYLEG